jgi:uncharacterized protein with PQ loop repeat
VMVVPQIMLQMAQKHFAHLSVPFVRTFQTSFLSWLYLSHRRRPSCLPWASTLVEAT